MSKALVIKGANFSVNKLDTVELDNVIPCTGITISKSSHSFTALGQTLQLTATATPADTTDHVEWLSSNDSIVTVSNAGLVTCVGVGAATVTAICGAQTATCTIMATATVNADTSYASANAVMGTTTDLTSNPVKDYVTATSDQRGRAYYSSTDQLAGQHKAYMNSGGYLPTDQYPIPLPSGASHVSIQKVANVAYIRLCLMKSDENHTNLSVADSARIVGHVYATTSATSAEIDIPEGADSFVFALYAGSGKTYADITDTVNVVFS